MTALEFKKFFEERISRLPPMEEEDCLDTPHQFLKMITDYMSECSDPIVGHFEMESRGIKYDGYFLDEDEKEFHVLSLIYFDDPVNVDESSRSKAFEEARQGALNFIKAGLKGKSSVSTETEIGEHIQEMMDDLSNGYKTILDFFSNVDLHIDSLPSSSTFEKTEIPFEFYDAPQIYETIKAEENKGLVIQFKNQYKHPILAIKIAQNSDFDVYLASISGEMLASVYRDNKSRLMEGNVRAYLKRTQKTNKGICQTLKTDPHKFAAYNNGISAVAVSEGSDIARIGDNVFLINALDKMQIVNGGQTTVTIFETSKDPIDLSEVVVPMKLTILKKQNEEAELVSNIAVYANTQTAISKSDLASNRPFYKSLESLSMKTACYRTMNHSNGEAYYWFFERTNGLYNTKKRIIWNYNKNFERQFPEKNKFSKKVLAKSIMAFSCDPVSVCMGNEKCFQEFNDFIEKNAVMPNEEYFKNAITTLILWQSADKIIKKNQLPIKAAVLPYTIAYVSYKTNSMLDLNKIWENQKIDKYLQETIDKVSRKVSQYFVSIQKDHPNTLMWGRKKECWEDIKKLVTSLPLNCLSYASAKFTFFPENLAATFIDNMYNFYKTGLWLDLIRWNNKTHALNQREIKFVEEIIGDLERSFRIYDAQLKKMGRKIFMKAVENGYTFQ